MRLQLEVEVVVVVVVWFGLVWNDDVCNRRARNAHQLHSDILASAKLQLYHISVHLLLYQLTS